MTVYASAVYSAQDRHRRASQPLAGSVTQAASLPRRLVDVSVLGRTTGRCGVRFRLPGGVAGR